MSEQGSNQKSNNTPVMRPGGPRGPRRGPIPGVIEKAEDPQGALKKLLPYLKPFTGGLILAFVLVITYTVLGLIGPYLMGRAIDEFISAGDLVGLKRIVIWMFVAYLGSSVFQAATNWVMANISNMFLKNLRKDLFEHLQTLSLKFFDQNPSGDLMSRLTNDIDAVNQAVSMNLTQLMSSVLTLVGIVIAMFLLNPWLALTSLIVIPIMTWFTTFVAKFTRKGFRSLQSDLGSLNAVVEEAISGQRVIKAFRRNDAVIADFQQKNQSVYDSGMYANTYALLLMPLTNVLGNLFVILLVGVGAWLALSSLTSVGVIATFVNYGRRFMMPLTQLANMYNSIQSALAGAERVFAILDAKPDLEDEPDAESIEAIKGDVLFDDVRFGYLPDVPVIRGMTIKANAGDTIALVGPTGAGKTTIINLLTRFYDIDSGKITIDGRDIKKVKIDDLRKRLGLVLQDTYLFSDTVMENIRYGRLDATDEECIAAAKMADADYFIRLLPNRYDTVLSERGSNLSQGQRQLLTIARAILADPGILILDEATSSVDTRTEVRIQQSLLRLMEGRTSFVIAHRLSTIRDADNVVVIDDGQIVEQGNHDELLEKKGFYYSLYMSQFKGQTI